MTTADGDPTREDIFTGLLAFAGSAQWGQPTDPLGVRSFKTRERRFKTAADTPDGLQPALYQVEPNEQHSSVDALPGRASYLVEWVIYQNTGKATGVAGTIENNLILDAIETILAPPPYATDPRQTIGGLVYKAYISGQVIKIAGDDDGQGMIVIPIMLIIP